ncbi:hypothetical protein AMATHDRAFT_41920 [Amanita thiersii Skay4041]|uniref:F-box domain-containing protein n=1 Tax=Amanita thiersii Skay4041 TaxID=703135 RepID=A0A2A9NMK0_9AGAR|nr:hypothetical protein AMATHDRAFT_41920 [Amanita thiersii Skay4041]
MPQVTHFSAPLRIQTLLPVKKPNDDFAYHGGHRSPVFEQNQLSQQPVQYGLQANTLHTTNSGLRHLPPIERLPRNLLAQVFIEFSKLSDGPYLSLCPKDPPMVFTRVNSTWRSVAYRVPELWSTIQMECNPAPPIEVIQRWITFSQERPLYIGLWNMAKYQPGVWGRDQRLFDYLSTFASRWKSLDVLVFPELRTVSFSKLHMPLLEYACIQIYTKLEDCIIMELQRAFSPDHAPRLKELSWSDDTSSRATHYVHLCFYWPQLVKVNIYVPLSITQCFIIFSLPLLQTVDLDCIIYPLSQPVDNSITLPNLQDLTLGANISITPILNALTLPSLRNVDIHFQTALPSDRGSFQDAFRSFLRRSHCPLEVLLLLEIFMDESHLLDCLAMISATIKLIDLRVPEGNPPLFTDIVVDYLTLHPNSIEFSPSTPLNKGRREQQQRLGRDFEDGSTHIYLCPGLSALRLSGTAITCSDSKFIEMMRSRISPPHYNLLNSWKIRQLSIFKLFRPRSSCSTLKQALRSLRDEIQLVGVDSD